MASKSRISKRSAEFFGLAAFFIRHRVCGFLLVVFPLLFLGFLSGCVASAPRPQQLLTGSLLWQGEVRVVGDVVLAQDAELTIAPGTQVLFLPPSPAQDRYQQHPYFVGSELIVRGRLHAIGTLQQPIVFRAQDPAAPPGSWGGINIEGSSDSRFDYCVFQQADSAVHARQARVDIRHAVFRNNLVGVRFHDTDLRVEQNIFEDNDTAIRFHFGSPIIRHNLIRNNRKGLFVSAEPRNYHIEQNAFIDNRPYQVNLGEGVRKPVNLAHNFWSEAPGEPLERLFFDGRLDEWLGRVEYLPVLKSSPPREFDP